MPIRKDNVGRYPRNWRDIRARILERARNACECAGECGQVHPDDRGAVLYRNGKPCCGVPHGEWIARDRSNPEVWYYTEGTEIEEATRKARGDCLTVGEDLPYEVALPPIKAILTVAHLDHVPENCAKENLLALCQRCHLLLDKDEHRENARLSRDAKRGQGSLFAPAGGSR